MTANDYPDPGPFPEELLRVCARPLPADNESVAFKIAKTEQSIRENCDEVVWWGRYTSFKPHTWGFNLYRACFGPGTDERFAEATRRLYAWVRYEVLCERYRDLEADASEDCKLVDSQLDPQELVPSRELAKRFHLNIIEDYPNKEAVISGQGIQDGEEVFSPVGDAFLEWVREYEIEEEEEDDDEDEWRRDPIDKETLYARNAHCLIIDEKALEALERLPQTTPEPGPRAGNESIRKLLYGHSSGAWVWMLDRDYFRDFRHSGPSRFLIRDYDDGTRYYYGLPVTPWIRVMLSDIPDVWIHRHKGWVPSTWVCVVQRDKEKFDRISWWNPCPSPHNWVYTREHKKALKQQLLDQGRRTEEDSI